MKLFRVFIFLSLFYSVPSMAGVGISVGAGFPYLAQGGLDFKASSDWSFYLGYSQLSVDIDSSSVDLSMPEALVRYHPFSKNFFIGVGVGQESLDASAFDDTTGQTVRAEVTAMTGIAKVGWMWGAADNQGFWIGVDASYIVPFGADTTITAPGVPTSDPEYQDVVEAADQFAETAYFNITFIRLGFLF